MDNWIKYYIFDDPEFDKITNSAMQRWPKSFANIRSKALAINNAMRNWGHQLLLDFPTMKNILNCSGFKLVEKEKVHHSKWKQLNNIERRYDFYSDFETLVIEARK